MENDAKVVFVNNLEVSGFVNGVLNLAFSTSQFVPDVRHTDGEAELYVAPAPVITANLRMDLWLAQQLHERLGQIIEENTKPMPQRMAS